MLGARGDVALEIRTEQREGEFWLVAALWWPPLGIDLDVGERRWLDDLAATRVKSGYAALDGRFAAHAREPAQAAGVVTPELLAALAPFEVVDVNDDGAMLSSRGAALASAPLDAFVAAALAAAE